MSQKKASKKLYITKASGESSAFSEEKLRQSLNRSGAGKDDINAVIEKIREMLYPGMSTHKIYKAAFKLLQKNNKPSAARYRLKNAMMDLGPEGYVFEKFIGALLEQQGYKTKTGIKAEGKCITHEIDVIAENTKEYNIIECKFHNQPGTFCDVKVPLYIHSRFRDVSEKLQEKKGSKQTQYIGWVVTNTRFSEDAIQYGQCAGLKLLSWDYPFNNSLKDQIDQQGLYPITCLTSLKNVEKKMLIADDILLCKSIINQPQLLKKYIPGNSRIETIIAECYKLCKQ